MKTKVIEVKRKRNINIGGYGNIGLKNYSTEPVFVYIQQGPECKIESGESVKYGFLDFNKKDNSIESNTFLSVKGRCTVILQKPISNIVAYRRMVKTQKINQ